MSIVEFSRDELRTFNLPDLTFQSYIKSGDMYFQPAGGLALRPWIRLKRPNQFSIWNVREGVCRIEWETTGVLNQAHVWLEPCKPSTGDDKLGFDKLEDVQPVDLGPQEVAAALGLKWEMVGLEKPKTGTEICNAVEALVTALKDKRLKFTREEFNGFNMSNLTAHCFIKIGEEYFKPAAGITVKLPEDVEPGWYRLRIIGLGPQLDLPAIYSQQFRVESKEPKFFKQDSVSNPAGNQSKDRPRGAGWHSGDPIKLGKIAFASAYAKARSVQTRTEYPKMKEIIEVKHVLLHPPTLFTANGDADDEPRGAPICACGKGKFFEDCHENKASGLKWKSVGEAECTKEYRLDKPKLKSALGGKTDFTQAEWNDFCIYNLHMDNFIEAGGKYFKPAGKEPKPPSPNAVAKKSLSMSSEEDREVIVNFRRQGDDLFGDKHVHLLKCRVKNLQKMTPGAVQTELQRALTLELEKKAGDQKSDSKKSGSSKGDEKHEVWSRASKDTADQDTSAEDQIPLVCVCVQGGPFTVDTVLQACQSGTPALLVRGSGKAADMLSDAVLLQYTSSHKAYVKTRDSKQLAFWKFMERECDMTQDSTYDGDAHDTYNWNVAIEAIQLHLFLLEKREAALERHAGFTIPHAATAFLKKSQNLVTKVYDVVQPGFAEDKCLQIILDCLRTAQTNKCWVFDLHCVETGYDDFNGALLKCLLNGVARVGEENAKQLKRKLEYTMLWSRDDLMDYLLERMSVQIDEKQRREIFNDAIVMALKKNKVSALRTLFHRGTGVSTMDVGKRFCFVQHRINYAEDRKHQKEQEMARGDRTLDEEKQETGSGTRRAESYFNAGQRTVIHRK